MVRCKRLRLSALLTYRELAVAVKDLLDGALMEDTFDDGYVSCAAEILFGADSHQILKISIYIEHISQSHDISPRATIVKGTPNFDTILREEVEGKYIRRVQENAKSREDMIVLGKLSLKLACASSDPYSICVC